MFEMSGISEKSKNIPLMFMSLPPDFVTVNVNNIGA